MTSDNRIEEAVAAALADPHNAFTFVDESAPGRPGPPAPPDSPLGGMPVALKDLIDQAGMVTTAGSAFYRHRPVTTAPAVTRLEEAGAVVIGRTGLHEFAFGFSSENPWFGPVLNPWDHSLSPGGSSGGSAAAVAAGVVPLAIGTDTGGSVRVPAALCAVAGLKVTHGSIPLEGVFPLVPSFDTVGAIASSLDVLRAATEAMTGRRLGGDQDPDPGRRRLIAPMSWVESAPLAPQEARAFQDFLTAASGHGLEVVEMDLPELGPSPHQGALIGHEVAAIHRQWRLEGKTYGDDVAERIDAALAVTPEQVAAARVWQETLTETMRGVTADGSVLVTPTVAAMDKKLGEDRIGGHHYRSVLSWFTAPVNPTGCPALSVPLDGGGRLPSIQLIGAHGAEPLLLEVARHLEACSILGFPRLSSA